MGRGFFEHNNWSLDGEDWLEDHEKRLVHPVKGDSEYESESEVDWGCSDEEEEEEELQADQIMALLKSFMEHQGLDASAGDDNAFERLFARAAEEDE